MFWSNILCDKKKVTQLGQLEELFKRFVDAFVPRVTNFGKHVFKQETLSYSTGDLSIHLRLRYYVLIFNFSTK